MEINPDAQEMFRPLQVHMGKKTANTAIRGLGKHPKLKYYITKSELHGGIPDAETD
jgi:hypothetical protein